MSNNPILDDLHAVRERLLDEAGGTLDDLVDRLQADERQSDRPRYRAHADSSCTPATTTTGMPTEESCANLTSPPECFDADPVSQNPAR